MEEKIRENFSLELDENLSYIKDLLKDNSDIVYREFKIGHWKAALICIDGMVDKILLDNFVIRPLLHHGEQIKDMDQIKDRILSVSDLKKVEKMDKAIDAILSGETMLLLDEFEACFIIASRSWANRGVTEPSGETVVRGARDGFTETIRFNTALVRRRIRDTKLRIKSKSLGERSKTDVALIYIEDIVNKEVLEDLLSRLDGIKIDAIQDSGYVHQLIEDNRWSLFPQIQSTERPDVVAASVYEGRVAILVDNSPFALIVPTTLPALFQSPDDYNQRWIYGSFARLLRLLAIFLSLVLPGLYVAVTSFHTSIIPTQFAYAIAATREGVPFPAFVEAIVMELSLALLIEAVIRLPKPIGATIGIVGGLIIGQAAVTAGIVSPIMIIIVSITAITSFITPNYEITFAFRIIRFLLIIASAIIGLYGLTLGLIVFLVHLVRLKSFGISYMSPIVQVSSSDMKDMFIRAPLRNMKLRPDFLQTGDKVRQK